MHAGPIHCLYIGIYFFDTHDISTGTHNLGLISFLKDPFVWRDCLDVYKTSELRDLCLTTKVK